MTIEDVALRVSAALGRAGVPFMLVGGFSSNYLGNPVTTEDQKRKLEMIVRVAHKVWGSA